YPIQPRPAPAPAVGQTVYLGPPPTPPADLRPRSNPPPSLFPVQLPVQPARIASASPRRALHVALGVAGAVAFLAIGIVAAVMMKASASADKHWVAPMVLSANDPRVVQVAATLQQETSRRSELLLEKTDLEGRLREAERGLQLEESFQASYQAALQADLANQRAELRRTLALLAAEESARSASSTESADKSVERQAKLAIVRQRIRLLESATKAVEGRLDLTRYSTVALQREYDASLITVAKGRELAAGLRKALAATESMLKEKDALLETILQSPYGAAISGDVTLGFLPYENVNEVNAGEPLFACRTAFLFCRQVGTVGERLPGEARGANPRSSQTQLRGQLVRLNLQERGASERPVLYAGRKPL
ncbi:MAG TPA: hypothetical protein VM925_28660, partial [Labilithrix sp.]|nr:hypothetical protein [Labilithrix sp.]